MAPTVAVKCLRRECARMTLRAQDQPRPEFCPYCGGPVEDVELVQPKPRWRL